MTIHIPFQPGVIEGFFGRCWSWQARIDAVEFLARNDYSFYIYAPKSDACLRSHWRDPWPAETLDELLTLRSHCRDLGVAFGIGLSPLELYREPASQGRAALQEKILYLNQLEPDILCLLFDDMRGDLPDLAHLQVELAHCAATWSRASHLILCPTYYSADPVLEKVFGQRPIDYWEVLGKKLDRQFDIFWTGPRVCSDTYPPEHLREVSALLQRKPFLWDNYPVNDSAVKSRFLQLRAVAAEHATLPGLVSGHAVNPMNQACLSRIPLLSLPRVFREGELYDPQQAFVDGCRAVCSGDLAAALIDDVVLFQDVGLDGLTETQRLGLLEKYQAWPDEACAQEVVAWLGEEYKFDPACLTE